MKESAGDVGRQVKAVLKRAGLLEEMTFSIEGDIATASNRWRILLHSRHHDWLEAVDVPVGDPIAIPRAVAEAAAAVRRAIQSGEAKKR